MNIIPTKKALPLFSYLADTSSGNLEETSDFYSWHANYFTFNRKKILVIVNDLSFSPIILADINAKNKKDIEKYIKNGIKEAFSYSNVSTSQINKYLLKIDKIELSKNYSRSMISINNNMIQLVKCSLDDVDFTTILQPKLMKFLANVPFKSLTPNFAFSTEIVERELNKLI